MRRAAQALDARVVALLLLLLRRGCPPPPPAAPAAMRVAPEQAGATLGVKQMDVIGIGRLVTDQRRVLEVLGAHADDHAL